MTEKKKENNTAKAAVETKENRTKKTQGDIITLASGIRVTYRPVGANAIREAQSRIKDAPMPTFVNPTTNLEEPNPASPSYIEAQKQVDEDRVVAAMNTMMLMGVELVDGVPERDEGLLGKWEFLELITEEEAEFARTNDTAYELYYKKYIVADASAITQLGLLAGVTQEQVAQAQDSFRRNA